MSVQRAADTHLQDAIESFHCTLDRAVSFLGRAANFAGQIADGYRAAGDVGNSVAWSGEAVSALVLHRDVSNAVKRMRSRRDREGLPR